MYMGILETSFPLPYKVRIGRMGPTLGGSKEVTYPCSATKNPIALFPEGALGWTLVPCKIGRMILHLESFPFAPTFCNLRAP